MKKIKSFYLSIFLFLYLFLSSSFSLPMSLLFLTSCTTLKKQQLYSGIAGAFVGGTLGALIGKDLSPDRQSERLNQTIGITSGVALGSVLGAGLGTFFWNAGPENKELKQMILNENKVEEEDILGPNGRLKEDINIPLIAPNNISAYKLEEGPIPDQYKSLVNKKGTVRVYEFPQYTERKPDGREIIHGPHKGVEYVIEDLEKGEKGAEEVVNAKEK